MPQTYILLMQFFPKLQEKFKSLSPMAKGLVILLGVSAIGGAGYFGYKWFNRDDSEGVAADATAAPPAEGKEKGKGSKGSKPLSSKRNSRIVTQVDPEPENDSSDGASGPDPVW